jgi:hypothetical protein
MCHLNPGYANPNLCYNAHDGDCDPVMCPWCMGEGEEQDVSIMDDDGGEELFAALESDFNQSELGRFMAMDKAALHRARRDVIEAIKELGEIHEPLTPKGKALHETHKLINDAWVAKGLE